MIYHSPREMKGALVCLQDQCGTVLCTCAEAECLEGFEMGPHFLWSAASSVVTVLSEQCLRLQMVCLESLS